MYTYGDVCGYNRHIKHRFKKLPKLDKSLIKPMWSMGHYDGIMSAMILYGGAPCFAECQMDPSDHRKARRFFVIKLKEDEFIREQIIHALFRNYVGTHCDLDGNWRRSMQGSHPDRNRHKLFYDHPLMVNRRAEPASDDDECLGWFEGFCDLKQE